MRFQRMLSNGSWIDEDRINEFVDMVLERETWFAEREGREPMTTREQVIERLATVKDMRAGDDWYDNVRDADSTRNAPRSRPVVEMVRCDCGHEVPRGQVMSASRGTSCPDCYDRMSD